MIVRNKYDRDGSAQALGQQAEDKFVQYIQGKNWSVEASNFFDDCMKHIDYRITKDGKTYTIDVKSSKKVSRSDTNVNTERLWIELKNVKGDLGWAYSPSLDLVGFQNGDDFLIVPRKDLIERVESLMQSNYVNNSYEALYSLYSRRGREDLLTQVMLSDILDLAIEL